MNAIVDEHDQHAVYPPSIAHRWTICTASAEAIAKLPPQEEGEEAKEGTEAHDEIERILGHMNGIVKAERFARPPVDSDHPAAYGVALVLDFVGKLPSGRMWIEQRVALTEQIWGRCDVAHWDEAASVLTIVDYKNGYVGVDAEENEQLRIYAAASIYTHKLPAKWIRYAIVQPNDFRPVPRVKQWVEPVIPGVPVDPTWKKPREPFWEFIPRIAAIPHGPKQFVAGEQCTYCPLFGRCPASRDVLTQIGPMLGNTPDEVSADQVAIFMACKKPIEDWFKALGKVNTKRAIGGAAVPGMKLVETVTKRAWSDDTKARALVIERLGVEALDPPTPAQAVELGIPEDVVNALAPRPAGGPALAFESDKRKDWKPKTAEEMFGAVLGK